MEGDRGGGGCEKRDSTYKPCRSTDKGTVVRAVQGLGVCVWLGTELCQTGYRCAQGLGPSRHACRLELDAPAGARTKAPWSVQSRVWENEVG